LGLSQEKLERISTSQTLLVKELYTKLENNHLNHEKEMSGVTS